MKRALALATLVVLLLPVALAAKDSRDSRDSGNSLVRFEGGIGVDPVSNGVGTDPTATTVTRNIVRGVQPPGQIWRIEDLSANVKTDGRIRVDGRGLLLAGGNNIGTNGNQRVFATLICEATPPFVEHSTSTTGVPLAANGDFRIDDVLSPAPPAVCASPVLLIRSAAGTVHPWFAAGIPKRDNDD